MTESETLLETCIHEAAHAAFVVWLGGQIVVVRIGESQVGEMVSGGYVSWKMKKDMPDVAIGAIAAAGKVIDTLRSKLSQQQIEVSSSFDLENLENQLLAMGADIKVQVPGDIFAKGYDLAQSQLQNAKKRELIECVGAALFRRCVNGAVELDEQGLVPLFYECGAFTKA